MSIETITGTVDADAVTAEAVMDDSVTADVEIVPISYSEGGSSVVVNPVQTDGTKIAEITVDQHQFDIFAPAGMHRYILRLVAVGGTWQIQDYYSGTSLSFADVKAAISDVNNYVVCVYGNSKLRPQYVSTNELMMIGLDRASSEAKILRILMTPTATTYTTYALAEKSDLTSGVSDVTIDGNSVVNDGVADIPVAATGRLGVIQVVSISGLKVGPTGILTLDFPTIEHVSDRKYGLNQPKPVTLGRLDYAVCASLTDGKSASLWTEDKQQAARALLGISIWDGSVSE